MDLSRLPIGEDPPRVVNVFVEIPQGGVPVKYELDKSSSALFVNRFLHTAMFYPGNYGFIPHTMAEDGDPVDVLVIAQIPVIAGSVLRCRPVGALLMEDEAGPDKKVLAVPLEQLDPYYKDVRTYSDLPQILRDQITHFFSHYKDLESGKWVKISRWMGVDEALQLIADGITRAQSSGG